MRENGAGQTLDFLFVMFTSPRGGFFKTIPCPFFIPSSSETSSQQRSCLKSAEHCHFLHSQPPPAPQLVKRSKSSKAGSAERQRLTAAAIVQQQPITSTSQASISTSFHSSSSSSAGGDGSVSGGGSGLKRLVAELEGFGGDLTYSSSSTTIRSLPSSSTPKHIKPVVHSIQKRAISSLLATENPVSAHVGSVGAPKIKSDLRAKVTRDQRQKTLDKFYSEFLRIYSSLMNCQLLAHEHSLTQETSVHEKSTKATYVTLSIGVLKRLRSRPVSTGGNDVGIDGEWTLPKTIPSKNDILKGIFDSETLEKKN